MSETLPKGVHPVADLFPMMTDDELEDLARDIAANGLIHPIVLDDDGQLIDGRNRLRACELAGVEPTFMSLNGHEPVAFILAANVARRHLSKGQAAMAVARAKSLQNKDWGWQVNASRTLGISEARISQAGAVLTHAPDLSDAVLSGASSLNDAYAEARKRKDEQSSTASRMARLQAACPDLAALIVEERMTLTEAEAAARERAEEEARQRRIATRTVTEILALLDAGALPTCEGYAADLAALCERAAFTDLSPERFRRCMATLAALARGLGGGTT